MPKFTLAKLKDVWYIKQTMKRSAIGFTVFALFSTISLRDSIRFGTPPSPTPPQIVQENTNSVRNGTSTSFGQTTISQGQARISSAIITIANRTIIIIGQ